MDEYDTLVPLPSCKSGQQFVRMNSDKSFSNPDGLNESYSVVKSQILMMNPLPSANQVYSLLNEEEMRRRITTTLSNHDAIAFYNS